MIERECYYRFLFIFGIYCCVRFAGFSGTPYQACNTKKDGKRKKRREKEETSGLLEGPEMLVAMEKIKQL